MTDLEALLDEHGTWKAAAEALHASIEFGGDAPQVDEMWALARIWLDHLGRGDRAVDMLESIADADLTHPAVARLADFYEAQEAWEDLVGLELDRLEATEDVPTRIALILNAADLYARRLGKPDGAVLLLRKAADEDPGNLDVVRKAEALALSGLQPDDMASLIQEQLAPLGERRGEAATLPAQLALGRVYLRALGNREMAEVYFERVASIDDGSAEARAALASIYEQAEDWDSLAELLEKQVRELEDDDEMFAAEQRLAEVLARHVSDKTRARRLIEKVVARRSDDPDLLDWADSLAVAMQDVSLQLDVAELRVDTLIDSEEQAQEWARIGRIHLEHLDDLDASTNAYSQALALDAGCVPAQEALVLLFAQQERWADVIGVLEAVVESATDDDTRIQALSKMALLQEKRLDDIVAAIATWKKLRALDAENDSAGAALTRLYEAVEDHQNLYRLLVGRAESASDNEIKAALYMKAGFLAAESLGEPFDAISALEAAIAIDDGRAEPLRLLATLYEQTDQSQRAVPLHEKLAGTASSSSAQVKSLLSAARIKEEQNSTEAVDAYRQVLALDDRNIEALEACERLLTQLEHWDSLSQVLSRHADVEHDLTRRAEILVRDAEVRLEHLNDLEIGWRRYEQAMEFDPNNSFAASALGQRALENERWERVPALLGVLIEDERFADSPEATASLHENIAYAYEQLGRVRESIEHYRLALTCMPNSRSVLEPLARLQHRDGMHFEAVATFRRLFKAGVDDLEPSLRAELFYEAGASARNVSQEEDATTWFKAAIDHDRYHAGALKALASTSSNTGTGGIDALLRLLEVTEASDERFGLLLELGDAYAQMLDWNNAQRAFRDALSIEPNSLSAHRRLLNVYMQDERWEEAAQVIGKLSALETNQQKKNQLLFTVAAIFRDQLDDVERAHEFFDLVLDNDPNRLDAFEALVAMLQGRHRWEELQRAYRRMIERTAGRGDDQTVALRLELLDGLARIYTEHLDRPDDAIASLQVAIALDPSNFERRVKLASIDAPGPRTSRERVDELNFIIERRPDHTPSYHRLFRIHQDRREFDRAWRIAAALRVIGGADRSEREFYSQLRPTRLPMAQRPLELKHWSLLYHPDADFLLTRLFGVLAQTIAPSYSNVVEDWGLDPLRNQVDLSQDHPVNNLFNYVWGIVQPGPVTVYYKPGSSGLLNGNIASPSMVMGDDFARATPGRQLVFKLGRDIALMRPEFYMASAFPTTDQLKVFVLGALAVYADISVPQNIAEQVAQCSKLIRKLPRQQLDQVGSVVQGFLSSGASPDVSRWLRGVQLTSNRIGLLLCGDLKRAVEVMQSEPGAIRKASESERYADMIAFSLSAHYEELRAVLSLGIGQQ